LQVKFTQLFAASMPATDSVRPRIAIVGFGSRRILHRTSSCRSSSAVGRRSSCTNSPPGRNQTFDHSPISLSSPWGTDACSCADEKTAIGIRTLLPAFPGFLIATFGNINLGDHSFFFSLVRMESYQCCEVKLCRTAAIVVRSRRAAMASVRGIGTEGGCCGPQKEWRSVQGL
jgi:hypothetical protein